VAEPLFLAHYNEKAGTGTIDMIALCHEAGLPEPEFRQDGGQFVMTLWRDWLTDSILSSLNLNERQRQAIAFVRLEGRITNAGYQKLAGGSRRTALRELDALGQFGILDPKGKGRGAHYVLGKTKRAINAPNAPQTLGTTAVSAKSAPGIPTAKRAKNVPNAPTHKRATKRPRGT
jgi:ATP-dependent DNA helicase RecG